jgi:hypothetical protein
MNKNVNNRREEFVEMYGKDTMRALETLKKIHLGKKVSVTAERRRSLAAYKANLTRGAYSPFVTANFARDNLNLLSAN